MRRYSVLAVLPLPRLTVALLMTFATQSALAQAQNTTTSYQYDANGNVTQITDPLGRVTNKVYDPLNRLRQQLQPAPTAGAPRPVINYTYDGLNQLTGITDPRSVTTSYTIDGLGNQTALTSPDSGSSSKTHDAAGNVLTSTDAKGQTTTYQYDELNRITRISYADGNVVTYQYDQGPNGIGRLTQITDNSGSIAYAYDGFGRVTTETRTIGGIPFVTRYTYDNVGHLTGMTYPSGRVISYLFDSRGRINQIDTSKDGITQTLVKQITYQPFGGVRSFINGANQTVHRNFDLDGRLTSVTIGNSTHILNYDAASRISLIWDTSNVNNVNNYAYDDLDRLTQYTGPQGNQNFGYDAVGNRLSQFIGSTSKSFTYSPTSNRLTQSSNGTQNTLYTIDPNGSITNNGNNQFAYDTRGRMTSANTAIGPVQYQLNALGQRIKKSTPTATTLFQYDLGGKLIGETNAAGTVQAEYVYLHDTPVAVLK